MTPRVGFLGVGWIGRNRMMAAVQAGAVDPVVVADASPDTAAEAAREVGADVTTADDLLAGQHDLDAVVIATPSALHAEQAMAALAQGYAVFCQKPLARTADETRAVVEAARRADRLLAVDLSYRFTAGVQAMRAADIGAVYAAELVFHNAYGPDKPWFTDPALAGGGCVIDLGIHLVDLLLWLTGESVTDVHSRLVTRDRQVEEYAVASLALSGGGVASLACSWFLPAGQDAVIRFALYGSEGAVELRNVGGSFYDFEAALHRGTAREVLAAPPDDWGGRAIVDWARRLADGERFDPENERLVEVARVVDQVYGR